MSNYNNIGKALRIVSQQNGWDPFIMRGDIQVYPDDRVTKGDFRELTPDFNSPFINNDPVPFQAQPTSYSEQGHPEAPMSDPMPDMPGAR